MNRLTACLGEKKGELQKSILYCVYCLLVKNYERYKLCFKSEALVTSMENTLSEKWTFWPFNVSERLTQLKDMTAQAYSQTFPSN